MKKIFISAICAMVLAGCSIHPSEKHTFNRKCANLDDAVVLEQGKALYLNEEGFAEIRAIDLNKTPITYNHFFFTGDGSYQQGDDDSFVFTISVEGEEYKADRALLESIVDGKMKLDSNEDRENAVEKFACYL
ncbi:hypothetical protein [Vibrio harveyi]|uniref:hypothetical protein n=1 Tax=Vibrio harveyi TaxID=669 RepID=UPI003CEC2CC6